MEPTNNLNPTPSPVPSGDITPPAPAPTTAEQVDQQAVEAAKNIIAPEAPQPVAPVVPAPVAPQVIAPQVITPTSPVSAAPTTIAPSAPAPTVVPTVYGVQTPAMVMGGVDNGAPLIANINTIDPYQKPSHKKKFILFGGLGAFLLVGGTAAFAFLWYIPNMPNNVWNTGFNRTGDQVDFVIKKLDDPKSLTTLEKNQVTLKGSLKMDTASYGIDLNTKYDKTNTNSTVKVDAASQEKDGTYNINAELRTQVITDAIFPNIYFKISGFSSLGLDSVYPNVNKYDGKWIAVEQDYLKQFEGDNATKKGQENVTQKDVMSIVNDANTVSQEYVFTSDTKKAVVQKVSFVGTEKSEGITANHYKAKLNETNVKAYCNAMVDKLSQNASVKKISTQTDEEFAKTVKEEKDSCDKTKVSGETFDLWIDKSIKVLHKVRLYEDLNKQNAELDAQKTKCMVNAGKYSASACSYYDEAKETGEKYQEFGQVFKSKDQIVLFAGTKSATNKDKSQARADIIVNSKALSVSGTVKASSENTDSKYTIDLTMKTEPYTGDVDGSKPAGAIPLQQVLDSLGQGNLF